MKVLATLWLVFFVLPAIAFGQGSRYDSNVVISSNAVPYGAQSPIFTLPFSLITICAYPDDGGQPCGNTVPIFSDQALTQTTPNPITADVHGRFGFWITAGIYSYSVVTQTGTFVGTFTLTVGGGGLGTTQITPGNGVNCTPLVSGGCTGNVTINGVSIQHNGTQVPIQNILNFDDTVPAAPTGFANVTFAPDSSGKMAGFAPNSAALQMRVATDPTRQSVVIYPNTVVAGGTATIGGFGNATLVGAPYCSPLIGGTGSIVASNFVVPPEVLAGTITEVDAFAIVASYELGGSGSCLGVQFTPQAFVVTAFTGGGVGLGTSNVLGQSTAVTSLTASTIPAATIGISVARSIGFGLGAQLDMPLSGLIIYYTGAPPPANNNVQIVPPLNFSNSSLSISPTASFPGTGVLPETQANTLITATAFPANSLFWVTDGCAGGATKALCVWDGVSALTPFSGIGFSTPSSSSAACTVPQSSYDASFVYVCTATNTWKRVTLSTF